jgi:CheY-like chemotaxis protein
VAKTILIVDDEYAIVQTLVEILQWEGYEVLTAQNGQEGLNELTKGPDVVLLDYMMPLMDGATMLEEMRADVRWRRTPVIMMSAAPETAASSVKRLWNAFLAKPFSPDRLLATLATVTKGGSDE